MNSTVVLRKLGKVLLMETDSSMGQLKAQALTSEGTSVEVVESDFQVLLHLGQPNHGYNLVFLGNKPMYPDAAKRQVLEQMGLAD